MFDDNLTLSSKRPLNFFPWIGNILLANPFYTSRRFWIIKENVIIYDNI